MADLDSITHFALRSAQAALDGASSITDAADPELPPDVLARLPEAEAHAWRQMASIAPESERLAPKLARELQALERSRRSLDVRYDAFLSIVSQATRAVQPKAACRRGCAHCCHIPLGMVSTEADIIGRRIRVKPVRPLYKIEPGSRPFGYQYPCPFLDEGACSIYEHRPVSCRLHFNLDRDDLLCRLIPHKSVPVPLADMRSLQAAYFFLTDADPHSIMGDVRDFFPRGRGR